MKCLLSFNFNFFWYHWGKIFIEFYIIMCSLSESSQSKCPLASLFSKCLDRKLPSKDDPVCTAIFWLGCMFPWTSLLQFLFNFSILLLPLLWSFLLEDEKPCWDLLKRRREKCLATPNEWGKSFFLFFRTPFLIFILGCYTTHCFSSNTFIYTYGEGLMKSWGVMPFVMNDALILSESHSQGYAHAHSCHAWFSFAKTDTMVTFQVLLGNFLCRLINILPDSSMISWEKSLSIPLSTMLLGQDQVFYTVLEVCFFHFIFTTSFVVLIIRNVILGSALVVYFFYSPLGLDVWTSWNGCWEFFHDQDFGF